jgi:hypothetical protein
MDPLTCDWLKVLRAHGEADCNCQAPASAKHLETCSVTPMYAQLCSESADEPRKILNDIWLETFELEAKAGVL